MAENPKTSEHALTEEQIKYMVDRFLGDGMPRAAQLTAPSERERELEALLNTPETEDFDKAVPLEAAHQVLRWSAEHDAGKNPEDWFWLIGYLAGKALHAAKTGDLTKAKHHCISTSAALRNWHAHLRSGESAMRPGIAEPAALADSSPQSSAPWPNAKTDYKRLSVMLYRSLERLSVAIAECARIGFEESSPSKNEQHFAIWVDLNDAQKNAKFRLKHYAQFIAYQPLATPLTGMGGQPRDIGDRRLNPIIECLKLYTEHRSGCSANEIACSCGLSQLRRKALDELSQSGLGQPSARPADGIALDLQEYEVRFPMALKVADIEKAYKKAMKSQAPEFYVVMAEELNNLLSSRRVKADSSPQSSAP